MSKYNVLYVGTKSNIEALEKHEKERGNRAHGETRSSNIIIHNDKKYDLEIDNNLISLNEIILQILSHTKIVS